MRFYWKKLTDNPDIKDNACKIMRSVEFPFKYDICDCCTPEIQRSINVSIRSEGVRTYRSCSNNNNIIININNINNSHINDHMHIYLNM